MQAKELAQMLDDLKARILSLETSDGGCYFDGERVKTMILLTSSILDKSISND